jgi:acyl-CoA synthetase (AMP-forming)/AMP-acid ligase II
MVDLRVPRPVHASWWSQVAAWRGALHGRQRVALFEPEPASFAAALFGAWSAGVEVVLPGDSRRQTAQAVASMVDAYIGAWEWAPKALLSPALPAGGWLPPRDDQRVLTVFTSGSSGAPLPIPKRFGQLAAEVAALEEAFGAQLGDDASVVSTVSHQHVYGLLFTVLWPLAAGRALPTRRYEVAEPLAQALSTPSVLVSSPALLRRLPPVPPWRTALRAIFSSGAPLPAEASQAALALLGQRPIEVYGSSETGGIASRREGEAWVPLPSVEVRVREGQLEVKSAFIEPGWLRTADAAQGSPACFVLQGRADRVVKLEDKRVSLDAVETAVKTCGLFLDAAVVVLTGAKQALGVVAVPVNDNRSQNDLVAAMRVALAGQFDASVVPRRLRLVDALPINTQGKIQTERVGQLFAPHYPPSVCLSLGADAAELELEVLPHLLCLDGHFPGAALVPGVALVAWALHFARETLAVNGSLTRVEALKFKSVMRPGDKPLLSLQWAPSTQRLHFRYRSAKGDYASGRLAPPGPP